MELVSFWGDGEERRATYKYLTLSVYQASTVYRYIHVLELLHSCYTRSISVGDRTLSSGAKREAYNIQGNSLTILRDVLVEQG